MTKRALQDPELYAAMLAAGFAKELDLPAGNMWEPGIARNMLRDYRAGHKWKDIEETYRLGLGLEERFA